MYIYFPRMYNLVQWTGGIRNLNLYVHLFDSKVSLELENKTMRIGNRETELWQHYLAVIVASIENCIRKSQAISGQARFAGADGKNEEWATNSIRPENSGTGRGARIPLDKSIALLLSIYPYPLCPTTIASRVSELNVLAVVVGFCIGWKCLKGTS